MKEYIQLIIDYIDNHLYEPLNLNEIANYIGFSKYYLNQVFSIYTGMSIIEYSRRRKLESAIDDLKTKKRIIDIALNLGYSSERSFSRAILREFGHSPSYFRHNKVSKTRKIVIYDLNLSIDEYRFYKNFPDNQKSFSNRISNKGVYNLMEYLSNVKYVTIDKMTVISCTIEGQNPEDEVIALMKKLSSKFDLQPYREFGFDSPVNSTEDAINYRGYEYWLAINNEDIEKLPSSNEFKFENHKVLLKQIPKYRYATIRIQDPFSNPFERIPGGWKALITWLEDHDFKEADFKKCSNANCLEEVLEIDGITVMDIFIPIG
ncbi:MAG: helix-turn-helix domain-containing protein [Tissierellales bacterium]|jgi:AraC family transcriptional regulator|nr:helix-turn-helix domain-containing protein [Tissierellales bacterium]